MTEANAIPCDTNKCHSECCGVVPIPNHTFKKNRHLLQRPVKIFKNVFPYTTVAVDEHGTCGFLSTDFKCAIYDQRPDVCKKFGSIGETHEMLICPHKKKWMTEQQIQVTT